MFDVVFELARHQHGAAAVWQVQPRGVGRSWLTRQCRRGVLYRRAPRVYVVAGAPATRRQELVVQVLSAGPAARATADSALAMWCSELDFPAQPEVTVPPTCGVRSGAMALRRSADMHLANPRSSTASRWWAWPGPCSTPPPTTPSVRSSVGSTPA